MLPSMNVARVGLWAAMVPALLVSNAGVMAADVPPTQAVVASPRIGLALSGGGARGIAHVGVLKVLDEMRIPISCITGTSMGSIVGGTFAAGRTPAELEKIVLARAVRLHLANRVLIYGNKTVVFD